MPESTQIAPASLINRHDIGATQLNSSLLTISVIAVLLPAAFHMVLSSSTDTTTSTPVEGADLLKLSHGVALILLFSAFLFSFFFDSKSCFDN